MDKTLLSFQQTWYKYDCIVTRSLENYRDVRTEKLQTGMVRTQAEMDAWAIVHSSPISGNVLSSVVSALA